jgi:uncharacterized membrane protein
VLQRHEYCADAAVADNEAYLGSPDNPRTAAVVGYITVIGWLIAYFSLYDRNKNSFAAFHLRQSLLLHILSFFLNVFSLLALWKLVPYALVVVAGMILFILWLIGAFRAINNNAEPVPLVGRWAQQLFKNI